MRRKGEDTFAMKRRRMPYVAKIERDDPFRLADKREIEAMVKRIAAAGEHFAIAGWREDPGFLLFHFPIWAKARAMQHGIGRNGVARQADAQARPSALALTFGYVSPMATVPFEFADIDERAPCRATAAAAGLGIPAIGQSPDRRRGPSVPRTRPRSHHPRSLLQYYFSCEPDGLLLR